MHAMQYIMHHTRHQPANTMDMQSVAMCCASYTACTSRHTPAGGWDSVAKQLNSPCRSRRKDMQNVGIYVLGLHAVCMFNIKTIPIQVQFYNKIIKMSARNSPLG